MPVAVETPKKFQKFSYNDPGELVGEEPLVFNMGGRTYTIDRYEKPLSFEREIYTTFIVATADENGREIKQGQLEGRNLKEGYYEDFKARLSEKRKGGEIEPQPHIMGTAIGEIVLSQLVTFTWKSDQRRSPLAVKMYEWLKEESHRYGSRFYANLEVHFNPKENVYVVKKTFPGEEQYF